jgi:hypothetical protein
VRSEEEKRGLASMKAHGQRWIRMANARSVSVGGTATQCLARTGD